MLTFDTNNSNESDWAESPRICCVNSQALPDAPSTYHHPFPETGVIPFQFNYPVTGKSIPEYITSVHYWIGNWPGESDKPCEVRPDATKQAEAIQTQ